VTVACVAGIDGRAVATGVLAEGKDAGAGHVDSVSNQIHVGVYLGVAFSNAALASLSRWAE